MPTKLETQSWTVVTGRPNHQNKCRQCMFLQTVDRLNLLCYFQLDVQIVEISDVQI